MRIGKVIMEVSYIVDLDNKEMVEYAKDALYEDLRYAVYKEEIINWIDITQEGCEHLTERDIPTFLMEEEE